MLRPSRFHCKGHGFDPGWETKIPQVARPKKKKKSHCRPPFKMSKSLVKKERATLSTCRTKHNLAAPGWFIILTLLLTNNRYWVFTTCQETCQPLYKHYPLKYCQLLYEAGTTALPPIVEHMQTSTCAPFSILPPQSSNEHATLTPSV